MAHVIYLALLLMVVAVVLVLMVVVVAAAASVGVDVGGALALMGCGLCPAQQKIHQEDPSLPLGQAFRMLIIWIERFPFPRSTTRHNRSYKESDTETIKGTNGGLG